ncbi:esterase-like activity of phytase family protein [Sphingomonas sp. NCPPB 2930]
MKKTLRTMLAMACMCCVTRAFAGSLALVATIDIPSDQRVKGHSIGGLSGVDFDERSHRLVFIEDDEDAHFLTARLTSEAGRYRVVWESADRLDMCSYVRGRKRSPADGESIRRDTAGGLVWSSEGRFKVGVGPSVTFVAGGGKCRANLPLPTMLRFDPTGRTGPRPNKVFEGMTFSPDGRSLWVAMEDALLQDGPASSHQAGGLTRISRFDRKGRLLQQVAYRLDPIQAPGVAGIADNGISEILSDVDGTLLVLERSGAKNASGHFDFYCRLYRIDPSTAADVRALPSLSLRPDVVVRKTLLLDFSTLAGTLPFNFEGMAWGPPGHDGGRTLLFISDNGFEDIPSRIMIFSVTASLP